MDLEETLRNEITRLEFIWDLIEESGCKDKRIVIDYLDKLNEISCRN